MVEDEFGTYRFVHRIVDALHLKVQDATDTTDATTEPRGFVDMGIDCNIKAD